MHLDTQPTAQKKGTANTGESPSTYIRILGLLNGFLIGFKDQTFFYLVSLYM